MFLMLITIGTGLLIASIADFTKYIKFRKRGCLTEGTIVDATTVCAETMKVYNSKWATISYKVDMNQETESYLFCNHQSRTKKNVLPVGKDIKSIVLLQK